MICDVAIVEGFTEQNFGVQTEVQPGLTDVMDDDADDEMSSEVGVSSVWDLDIRDCT